MSTQNVMLSDRRISVDMTLTSCGIPSGWHREIKEVLNDIGCYSVSDPKWDLVAGRIIDTFGTSFWSDLGKYNACFTGDGDTYAKNQCMTLLRQVVSDELGSFLL